MPRGRSNSIPFVRLSQALIGRTARCSLKERRGFEDVHSGRDLGFDKRLLPVGDGF
jgi:hypothetical protein